MIDSTRVIKAPLVWQKVFKQKKEKDLNWNALPADRGAESLTLCLATTNFPTEGGLQKRVSLCWMLGKSLKWHRTGCCIEQIKTLLQLCVLCVVRSKELNE